MKRRVQAPFASRIPHRCLNNLLSPHAAAELTTAQVRYELMEAFEDVFPSMELCVQEKKDQLKGTVDEMVLEDEEREDYV